MRILIVLLACLPGMAMAQSDAAPGIPRLTLKTNVSTLLNPFKQAYGFGTDLRLTQRTSVDLGAGAFINSATFANNKGESYRGLRLRAGFKYYLKQGVRYGFHIGLEGKYHDITNQTIREVFRQGQQYTEFLTIERKIKTVGLGVIAGWQFYLGQHRGFLIEPYAGVGVLLNNVTRSLPADAELLNREEFFSFEYEPGQHALPDLLIGVHVGFALW